MREASRVLVDEQPGAFIWPSVCGKVRVLTTPSLVGLRTMRGAGQLDQGLKRKNENMASTIELLSAARLKGRINTSDSLELFMLRDSNEVVTDLDISSDALPIRIEVYDFEHQGVVWKFQGDTTWTRDSWGVYMEHSAWADSEEPLTLTVTAQEQPLTLTVTTPEQTAAAKEKSKQIYVTIDDVVQGPDKL